MADTPEKNSPKFAVAQPGDWAEQERFGLRQKTKVDFRTLSGTGLNNLSGLINEERVTELRGRHGCETFQMMVDSDAVCGGMYYVFDKVLRQVPWDVERASDHPADRDAARFLEECLSDMDITMSNFISEVGTFFIHGFSAFEINWKQRGGQADAAWLNSKYSDGRIGIRTLSIMAQETCDRWLEDAMGNLLGVEQQLPTMGKINFVPYSKMLLFRTTVHKNNPVGRSLLRSAYRAWTMKRAAENIEAIGMERDAAGLPVIWAPDYVTAEGNDETQKQMADLRDIASNIRRNRHEGMVMPLRYDAAGHKMFEIELLTSAGTRQFDSDKIIRRYNEDIVNSIQAGFILLGQGGSGGSYAMHADKSELFTQGVAALVKSIEEVLNDKLIPQLFRLNAFPVTELPRLKHGSIGNVNLKDIGEFMRNLAGAGLSPPPDKKLVDRLLELAGLPQTVEENRETPPDPLAGMEPETEFIHDDKSTSSVVPHAIETDVAGKQPL